MHHQKTAGASQRTIISVGETSIEGKIFTRVGIYLIWSDVIEAFGGLMIPLHQLGSKIS